jgi:uncharacterized membrane protein
MTTTTDAAPLVTGRAPRDLLKIISVVLAVIGIVIAGYLTWTDVINVSPICVRGGSWDCAGVNTSIYARIGPIPVAVLGLAGYWAILATLLLEAVVPFFASRGKVLVFCMTLFGLLFSGYLTAIEAFRLRLWCVWCVGSAVTMTALFIVSFARLWRAISAAPEEETEEAAS